MSKLKTLIFRENIVESFHDIKCYIKSFKGENIFSTNDEKNLIYPRSSIKIFQSIPFLESNAINLYNLNTKQIALSCSSHCGEKFHLKELISWLKKIDLKASDLKCGIHNPLHKTSSEKVHVIGCNVRHDQTEYVKQNIPCEFFIEGILQKQYKPHL